ncbi:MAG TPA: hypothetical protein VGV15_18700 [Terriglobales bacterium]|nr:hypothetical protein [Terriglobales bacterium]
MHRMTAFPQLRPTYRASRLRVTDFTPVVLRFQNGGCTTGNIEVISLTGGLLCLPKPIDRGSCVKLMFLSQNGPVLGTAELLSPVSRTRQPFQFLALSYSDQRRLQAATEGPSKPGTPPQAMENSQIADHEQEWIEKYRAAVSHRKEPRRLLKLVLGAGTLATLSLGYVIYLFSLHLK